jgi:ParB-like chromosome segregation protein Spo0J
MAARHTGIERVPVYWVDVDDATARRILLADNRTAELATYDNDQLVDLLTRHANAGDLLGTGWDADDVDDLIAQLADGQINPPDTPDEFPSFDEDSLDTEHICPKCGFEF